MSVTRVNFTGVSADVKRDIYDKNIYEATSRIFDDMYNRIDRYNNITKNVYN